MDKNFTNLDEIQKALHENHFILVGYYNLDGYPGMVLCIMLRYQEATKIYELDLEYECLGLDFYGDTLQESYVYEFESLESMTGYIATKYNIAVTDIPVKYNFEPDKFPNALRDRAREPEFRNAWEKFVEDFKAGLFLDESLNLVYSSTNRSGMGTNRT